MPQDDDQLYVRVDGYKILLQDLEAVRQIVNNINEATQVLRQIRQVKEKTIDTVYENLDQMNDKLEDVRMEMPEIEDGSIEQSGVQVDLPEEGQEVEIDESVEQLHSELENLQSELSDINE